MSLPLAGAEIIKKRVMYLCDPDLNTECRKTSCIYYGEKWCTCKLTSNPEVARKDKNGQPIIWEIHYYQDDRIVRVDLKNRQTEVHDEVAMEAMAEVLDHYLESDAARRILSDVRTAITEKRAMEEGQHES